MFTCSCIIPSRSLPTFDGAKIIIIFEIPTIRYDFFFYLYAIEIKTHTISERVFRFIDMKKYIIIILIGLGIGVSASAQERTVENRPYTDLRPFHLGIFVGTHFQDIEFTNVGPTSYTDADGNTQSCNVTVDQDRWDPGFTVGVLGEIRLNSSFQFRIAPAMYFGTRHLTYRNLLQKDAKGNDITQTQEMKTAYISSAFDLIFAAERFNNHRPYIMAGLNPMMNLTGSNEDYIKLKKSELFLELGIGCDFYLPFFKIRPELKFMYGITDSYDKSHVKNIKDKNMLPYTMAAKSAHSKMIALTFYFE